jgi:hypothetical protein
MIILSRGFLHRYIVALMRYTLFFPYFFDSSLGREFNLKLRSGSDRLKVVEGSLSKNRNVGGGSINQQKLDHDGLCGRMIPGRDKEFDRTDWLDLFLCKSEQRASSRDHFFRLISIFQNANQYKISVGLLLSTNIWWIW